MHPPADALVPACLLLALNVGFWGTLSVARLRAWTASGRPPMHRDDTVDRTARGSRALVALHAVGFLVLYASVGDTFMRGATTGPLAAVREAAGTAAIVAGAVIAARAMTVLRSWRLRAALATDHQLTTDGIFAWVRHPIYAALDLYAVGTVLWAPHLATLAGAILVALGGDLRARAEERLLIAAYGDTYRTYAARTKRILPGVY
jgi:protein-S-isoprenylcysteine O-methyltransferase Ste14